MESTCKQNSNDLEINDLIIKYKDLSNDSQKCERFSDLPLSQKTLNGLSCSNFIQLTNIQRDSIGWALQGKDVVGCAITGSGKTLAFLIPIVNSATITTNITKLSKLIKKHDNKNNKPSQSRQPNDL